jgi:hypothetical protein
MTKNKKNRIHQYFQASFILLLVTALIASLLFFMNFSSYFSSEGEKVVLSNNLYKITGNPTKLQKDLFNELTNELENQSEENELTIVGLVVENFIADYYTWSNKVGTYDIGGKNFIFAIEFTNFVATSRRYNYNAMSNFLTKGINQKDLNEVIDITILSVNLAYPYDYYGQGYPTYYVEAEWTYKTNEAIDLSIFPTWAAFTLVKNENGRYEIVRFY